MRRLVAGGAALVVLLIFIFAVRSCASSRTETALKDYNREVSAIATSSAEEVGQPFFELLGQGAGAQDLQVKVNQLRLIADEDVKRADALDVPGQMEQAQAYFTQVLNLRSQGMRDIAGRLDDAASDNAQTAEDAVAFIAGQMRLFDASDVIYSQRVVPAIDGALRDKGIGGQRIAPSAFLPAVDWLQTDFVAGKLGAKRSGGGRGEDPNPAPGTHGHGLLSTAVGQTALNPQPAVNTVSIGTEVPTFTIKFQNQGENDETQVKVSVRLSGGGTRAVTATRTVNQTTAGQEATVAIPLTQPPPTGQPLTVTASVAAVPGEKVTDNNRSSYTVLFRR